MAVRNGRLPVERVGAVRSFDAQVSPITGGAAEQNAWMVYIRTGSQVRIDRGPSQPATGVPVELSAFENCAIGYGPTVRLLTVRPRASVGVRLVFKGGGAGWRLICPRCLLWSRYSTRRAGVSGNELPLRL